MDAGRFDERRIAVIGLGYVGLPLALSACEAGLEVVGLDVDVAKIPRLARGESYLRHIPSARRGGGGIGPLRGEHRL